jgi:hypothetical protein
MPERSVGKVEHYYPKVQAAAVRLTRKVRLGDRVHIVGHGDDFQEEVTSLQLDRKPVEEGRPGQSVGLWVKERVHKGDDVLLVEDEAERPRAAAKPRKAAAAAASRSASKRKPKAAKAAKPRKTSATARKAKAGARPARKARKPQRKKR